MQKGFAPLVFILVFALFALAVTGIYFYVYQQKPITSFEECVKAGNLVLESYPAQCNTRGGKHFVQQLTEAEKQKITLPVESSPSSTVKPDSTLKKYTNLDGNYEFSYSSDYTLHIDEVHEFETENYLPAKDTLEIDHVNYGVVPMATISFKKINPTTSLNDFISKSTGCSQVQPGKGKNILIGGILGERFDTSCGIAGSTEVYFLNRNLGYVLSLSGNNGDIEPYFSTIVMGFKFLK